MTPHKEISPFLLEDINIKTIFSTNIRRCKNLQIISRIISASWVANAHCSFQKITRQSNSVASTAASFPFDCCHRRLHKPTSSSFMYVFKKKKKILERDKNIPFCTPVKTRQNPCWVTMCQSKQACRKKMLFCA